MALTDSANALNLFDRSLKQSVQRVDALLSILPLELVLGASLENLGNVHFDIQQVGSIAMKCMREKCTSWWTESRCGQEEIDWRGPSFC